MDAISSYIGTEVYCNGKVIGRINDFLINTRSKTITGVICTGNIGIIRSKFFVERGGIMHLDRNGAVINKNSIKYKKSFLEEYGDFGIYKDNDYFSGTMGDMYFDPLTLEIKSVSIKKGFLDDLIYGRDIVDIKDISMTDKGLIIVNRE